MSLSSWFSEKVSNAARGIGNFASDQLSNAGRGLRDGFFGSATPRDPNKPEQDKPFLEDIFGSLAGGAKKNWLEILVGGFLSITLGRWLGGFVPGGLTSTIATMAVVGTLGGILTRMFTGHAEDDPASPDRKPVARVNMPSVPGGTPRGSQPTEELVPAGP